MEKTAEQRVAEAINEKGKWIKIGWMPFYMRPITYGQIADLSAEVSQLEGFNEEDEGKPLFSVAMKHGKDFTQMCSVVCAAIFRSKWTRYIFGRYLRRHLTGNHFRKVQEYIFVSVDPAFFLQSIIFLKGMNRTEPTKEK